MDKNLTMKILKIIAALIAAAYFFNYANQTDGWIFLNNFDLLIHEAGHWLFSPFGEFMHVLGGSLNQILIPIIFVVYFFINRKFYSAALTLFWVGENFIYVANYAADAVKMQLPLLGGDGVIHDWNWLLIYTGQLHYTAQIASGIKTMGILLLIMAMVWAIIAAWKDHSNTNYGR
jgi:hypothetical protein